MKPVLDSLVTMRKMNVWTEIVYLVVPTLNDSDKELTIIRVIIDKNEKGEIVEVGRFERKVKY